MEIAVVISVAVYEYECHVSCSENIQVPNRRFTSSAKDKRF